MTRRIARLALLGAACVLELTAVGAAGAPKRPLHPSQIAFWNARDGLALFRRANCYEQLGCAAVGRTTDGGRTWALTPVSKDWGGLVAAPGHVAWASIAPELGCGRPPPGILDPCGLGQTLRSRDGGRTWTTVGERWGRPPRVVSYPTKTVGFAFIGSSLVRTRDGGRSWSYVRTPCGDSPVGDVSFATPSRGWILCDHEVARGPQPEALFATIDGGRRWKLVMDSWYTRLGHLSPGAPYPGLFPSGISFARGGVGLLFQSGGLTYQTRDGGRTWRHVRFTTTGYGVAGGPGVQISARLAYLLVRTRSEQVDLRRTDDGGRRWRIVRVWKS